MIDPTGGSIIIIIIIIQRPLDGDRTMKWSTCFYVDADAGLKLHDEMISEDCNFFNQPSDEILVKLDDLCVLGGDEVLQFLEPCKKCHDKKRYAGLTSHVPIQNKSE